MKIERISTSRISCWNQCKLMYKYKYHDKIKSTIKKPGYQDFGHFIHYAFEIILKNNISTKKAIKTSFEKYKNFEKSYMKTIPKIFREFDKLNKNLQKNKIQKQYFELEISIPIIEDENFFNEYNNGIIPYFYGHIDRIINYDKNCLMIDYKTGNPRNEIKTLSNCNQMIFYTYLYNQYSGMPIKNITSMYFYPRTGNYIFYQYPEKKIYNFIDKTKKIIKQIIVTKPENVKANIQKLCNYCDYRNICPKYKQYLSITKKDKI